jgi:hypothetical protein
VVISSNLIGSWIQQVRERGEKGRAASARSEFFAEISVEEFGSLVLIFTAVVKYSMRLFIIVNYNR